MTNRNSLLYLLRALHKCFNSRMGLSQSIEKSSSGHSNIRLRGKLFILNQDITVSNTIFISVVKNLPLTIYPITCSANNL